MSIHREFDPMPENRTQLAFKGKIEEIVKGNIPNLASPKQNIDIEIQHSSRDHVIVTDTIILMFNPDIESKVKTSNVVKSIRGVLIKEKDASICFKGN